MKKLIAITLALLLALSFAACAKQPLSDGGAGQQTTAAPAPEKTDSAAPTGETAAPKNGLATDGSRVGVLQTVQEQSRIRLNGLIITTGSGHHDYPSVQTLFEEGYRTEGLCSEFFLDEWFEFYGALEGSDHVDVCIVANDPEADYTRLTPEDLAAAAESLSCSIYADRVFPDAEDYGHLFNAYVNSDLGAGLYNVFFTIDRTICYMVQLKIVPLEA